MPSIRDLNSRVSVLRGMQKVMRAMNMIATIKLRKLFRLQSSLALFEKSVDMIQDDIRKALGHYSHPLITGYDEVKNANVIIFTADKGLCGSHNSSVQKALDILLSEKVKDKVAFDVTSIGTRGASYCKRKEYKIFHQAEINDRVFTGSALMDISSKILKRLMDNEIQEIYLIANYFVSTLHQNTKTSRLLPLQIETKDVKKEDNSHMVAYTEPGSRNFIVSAGGLYLYYKLRAALLNSYLSEQSSRMTAMENATHNSEDLIGHYATLRNRARQAAITSEIIEIISGKEALKG